MDVFINILIFLHIFGLVLGMGSGMAMSGVKRAMAGSADATAFDGLISILGRNGHVGLAILWITGPLVVWLKYGGVSGLDFWFWIKIVFVVILSAALGIGAVNFRKGRAGDVRAAAIAKRASAVTGISGLIVIFAAVFAFN